MNAYEKILEKYGLTEKDLDSPGHIGERETLQAWANQMQTSDLSLSDVRDGIESMRYVVELELVKEPEYISSSIFPFIKVLNPKNTLLKARLHNYLLLEAFLARPGKTKKALERAINSIKVEKKV